MLVHKTVDVRAEVWRKLRVDATLSGVALRDYLSFLIERSQPISEQDTGDRLLLLQTVEQNQIAARATEPSGS